MKYTRFSFLISLLFVFSACKKENMCDCFKRTGSVVFETRELPSFDRVYVENNLNVFITQDSVFEVKVEAGKNLVPLIKLEVVDGTLFCRNKNRCNWTRAYGTPLNVHIRMPLINYITSDGTGDIKSMNTITTPEFEVRTLNSGNMDLMINNNKLTSRMHGSCDITLNGITGEHSCDIGGTGYLNAEGLQTNFTYIHSYTLGLSYIRASGFLISNIDYQGDVHCYGQPVTIQNTETSSGRLILE